MEQLTSVTDEIFPKDSGKTYTLAEIMPGESPMVGKGPENTLFSFPIVLLWEIILLLGVTFILFVFSLVKQAPLEEIANPLVTTDPAKAPWYFVGLQELLEHMHPTLAGVVIPTFLVIFLIMLPYIDHDRKGVGLWFSSARGKKIVLLAALYSLVVMPVYIVLDNAFSPRELLRNIVPPWITQGLIPALIIALIVATPVLILRTRKGNTHEVMLALFTMLFVSAMIFTITGFLFRGPGFKLYLPWKMPRWYNPWDGL